RTQAQVEERRRIVREKMLGTIGPLPERTDLKPQITGRLARPEYIIEKIVFQSQPGFYVTADFYLPARGQKPFPAVLGACGHYMESKAAGEYQRIWISLAKLGFAVLAFDPPGQGERLMYFDKDMEETILEGTVTEHTMPGIQCLLTGANVADYFIWDAMRAIDYLVSRPEIDPKRIAVTGNSGGGTQTAYIAALDDRVAAAAPNCWLTSWQLLWETIGPQDAEQNMLPFIASGLDHPDYAIAFAPKPYQISASIQDFFNIIGTRNTYAEARRLYEILGAGDNLELVEADHGHGYFIEQREAFYTFLGKHFLGLDKSLKEPELRLETERDLLASPTGQVATSYADAQSVYSLNAAHARKIMPPARLPASVAEFESFRDELNGKVRKQIGFEHGNGSLNVQNRGFSSRPGMAIELVTFDSEPGITLPALICRPEKPSGNLPPVLYLADRDKADDIGGDIARLVGRGHTVFAPDLRGKGETQRNSETREGRTDFIKWFSEDWKIPMMAFQVGRNLVGMRVLDLVRAVDVMTGLQPGGPVEIIAIGKGSASVPLIHAAILDKRITRIVLERGLVSWKAMVEAKYHRRQLDNVVPGALAVYDLPALAACLAPRWLVLSNTADPMGHFMSVPEVSAQYGQALHCYKLMKSLDNLVIAENHKEISLVDLFPAVLGETGPEAR
ncbi:MAG TPA: acetylxylan esterase, partial [Candidatus Glassbacteria bacterium]|nr:acetylxylan esterase [Candidatus Glassbacteria bacterium]